MLSLDSVNLHRGKPISGKSFKEFQTQTVCFYGFKLMVPLNHFVHENSAGAAGGPRSPSAQA